MASRILQAFKSVSDGEILKAAGIAIGVACTVISVVASGVWIASEKNKALEDNTKAIADLTTKLDSFASLSGEVKTIRETCCPHQTPVREMPSATATANTFNPWMTDAQHAPSP